MIESRTGEVQNRIPQRKGKSKGTRPRGLTFGAVCKAALALPGVELGTSWGTPGLKVKGRFLARLKEDGESLVLRIGFLRREELMSKNSEAFYITDHYLQYPAVLIRLPRVQKGVFNRLLKEAWGEVAPESLLSDRVSVRGGVASKKRKAAVGPRR